MGNNRIKLVVVVLIAAILIVAFQHADAFGLATLARGESDLRDFQARHPVLIYGAAAILYIGVTGLSLPGATLLSLAYAWFFGFTRGLLLVSCASTAGATVAFLLSRYLFRDLVSHRLGDRLGEFQKSFERDGPLYLFSLRLLPVIPFVLINGLMGLTTIRTRTFWWVSQLGMLPGTAVYVYAGSRVPSLQELAEHGIGAALTPSQLTQIFIALCALGLLPIFARFVLRYLRPKSVVTSKR